MNERYSVYYFPGPTLGLPDGHYEIECKYVPLAEAQRWFKHHTTNVTAQMGLTYRVIVTNALDEIVAEWVYGKGYVWPKEEESK